MLSRCKACLWHLEGSIDASFQITQVAENAFFKFLHVCDTSSESSQAEYERAYDVCASNMVKAVPVYAGDIFSIGQEEASEAVLVFIDICLLRGLQAWCILLYRRRAEGAGCYGEEELEFVDYFCLTARDVWSPNSGQRDSGCVRTPSSRISPRSLLLPKPWMPWSEVNGVCSRCRLSALSAAPPLNASRAMSAESSILQHADQAMQRQAGRQGRGSSKAEMRCVRPGSARRSARLWIHDRLTKQCVVLCCHGFAGFCRVSLRNLARSVALHRVAACIVVEVLS